MVSGLDQSNKLDMLDEDESVSPESPQDISKNQLYI